MILETTIPIELPSGGLLEIDVEIHLQWYEAEGDNWNSPRIEAHWEQDGFRPVMATWYHPDGSWTTIPTPAGSFKEQWLWRFLDKRSELIAEAVGAMTLV